MTDRIKGLVVTFDRDIREDDVEGIINAISLIKGVIGVDKSVVNINDRLNRVRVQSEIRDKIWKVLYEK